MTDFVTGLKSMDMEAALIVGFWVPKSSKEHDDPGVILELWDHTSIEKPKNKYVEENYDKGNE